jgi:hypothetical protein
MSGDGKDATSARMQDHNTGFPVIGSILSIYRSWWVAAVKRPMFCLTSAAPLPSEM